MGRNFRKEFAAEIRNISILYAMRLSDIPIHTDEELMEPFPNISFIMMSRTVTIFFRQQKMDYFLILIKHNLTKLILPTET